MGRYEDYLGRARVWSDIQGHLPFLYDTVRGYRTPVVIELGVREGNSTAALLAGVEAADGDLWSADIAAPAVPPDWHEDARWHFLQADDLHPDTQSWMPAVCDVLFIDTSHTYGHTLAELETYVPRVRPGGTVLLHDTQFVATGGGNGDDAGEPAGEVAAALDAYCGQTGLSWSNRPGSYGLGVIRL